MTKLLVMDVGSEKVHLDKPMGSDVFDLLERAGIFRALDKICETVRTVAVAHSDCPVDLARLLPHAQILVHDNGSDPIGIDGQATLLDCRPSARDRPMFSREAGGVPSLTLFIDGVARALTGGETWQPTGPAGPRYYILTTPRSGSTFLCDLLTSTNRLGRPTEHLKPWLKAYLSASGVTFAALIESLHRHSATANGVFGTKIIIDDLFGFFPDYRDEIFAELRRSTVFCLVRGDKAAQALSAVRSDRLSIYHAYDQHSLAVEFPELQSFKADLGEVFAKERWLRRQEADLLDALAGMRIYPKILSYEAISQSRQGARTTLHEFANELHSDLDEDFIWPFLVKISETISRDNLERYEAFRAGARLFSTRSEPWLGEILGDGWSTPENWGAHTNATQADILVPNIDTIQLIELLFTINKDSPRKVTIGTETFHLPSLGEGQEQWRWTGFWNFAPETEIKLEIKIDQGVLNLEEVVLYKVAPSWLQTKLSEPTDILVGA